MRLQVLHISKISGREDKIMELPYLKNITPSGQKQVVEFKGYNANSVILEGEMSETMNISTNEYPCLTLRHPRKVIKDDLTAPTALFGQTELAYVDGTNFYYNGADKGLVTEGKKQMATIGDKIIIFPDKTYYDISDDVYGTLEKTYTSGASQITFASNTITTTGADFDFRAGDAIKITGCTVQTGNNTTAVIKSIAAKVLTFEANTFAAGAETAAITLKREVPDMDYICEYNNRLWGCKGSMIYGSKLGDPFNFYVFPGLASDSYYVPVGSDGDFTGCIGYTTHLVFLKENYIHKLFGSKPTNYQIATSRCQGLQAGSEKSLVIINDILFYKSRLGAMAYSGTIPELISEQFGRKQYSEAVGGTDGEKYYLSLKYGSTWDFMVYDIKRSAWVLEDNTKVIDFTLLKGKLYYLDGTDKKIYQCNDIGGSEVISWKAVFGEVNESLNQKKGYKKFLLHIELNPGSMMSVLINSDRTGWKEIKRLSFSDRRTVVIPIIPTRCDIFSLKLEGTGWFKIYSLTKEIQVGSEV
jgi:hypothetical protein